MRRCDSAMSCIVELTRVPTDRSAARCRRPPTPLSLSISLSLSIFLYWAMCRQSVLAVWEQACTALVSHVP